jgi:hypothetical protein
VEVDVGEVVGKFPCFLQLALDMDRMELAFLSYPVDNNSRVTEDE